MTILTILTYPHPALRQRMRPVSVFDAALSTKIADMFETMYHDDAVGLAANQVGYQEAIMVIDVSDDKQSPLVLINPEIIVKKGTAMSEEGCASVPELNIKIPRAAEITVRAQNALGEPFILENVTLLLSYCIQHEIDHLNGKLFFDYLSPLKKSIVIKKLKKMASTV